MWLENHNTLSGSKVARPPSLTNTQYLKDTNDLSSSWKSWILLSNEDQNPILANTRLESEISNWVMLLGKNLMYKAKGLFVNI